MGSSSLNLSYSLVLTRFYFRLSSQFPTQLFGLLFSPQLTPPLTDTSDHYADFRWRRQPEQLRSLSEDLQWQTQESEWLQHTRHLLHVARIQVRQAAINICYNIV